MITGGKRKDPYLERVTSRLRDKFKLLPIEYENYAGWSKIIFAGMVNQLFPVWDFSDPLVSHLYNEWDKHLSDYEIELCSSGGNHTYMYFEKYFNVDKSQFTRRFKIHYIHFENNEWLVGVTLNGFDGQGKRAFYHETHRIIPERWAKKLIDGKPVSTKTRMGLLAWYV
jgi:hypothetical protein